MTLIFTLMQTEVYVTKYPIAKNFRFCNTDAKSLMAHRRKDLLFWILEFGTERAYIFLILDRIGVFRSVLQMSRQHFSHQHQHLVPGCEKLARTLVSLYLFIFVAVPKRQKKMMLDKEVRQHGGAQARKQPGLPLKATPSPVLALSSNIASWLPCFCSLPDMWKVPGKG